MDYYAELGVSKGATEQEIKKAYRALAKEYHPDRNKTPEAEDKIKRINEAYETLGDKTKRKQYDSGHSNVFSGFGMKSGGSNFDMSDIFSQGFSGFNQTHKKHNIKKTFKADDEIVIDIEFEEAILGVSNKIINHIYKYECHECHGHGGIFTICPDCGGTGNKNQSDGFISINMTCRSCMGTGKKRATECHNCNNKGYVEKAEELTIRIPEGLESRTRLFVKGKGNYINNVRGDLYINVNIIPTKNYQRQGNNIIFYTDIDVLDIMLEKTIDLETIKGLVSVDLTNDIIHKEIIEIGLGTKAVKGDKYGDMIIKVSPKIPHLTENQKEILKTL